MSSLEITDVRVRPYSRADDKLKAFATITFNDCFVVSDLKVINGNNGLFVAMPSRKRKDGKFRDVAHPLNSETRQMIEDRVIALYNEEMKNFDPSKAAYFEDDEPLEDYSPKFHSTVSGNEVNNEFS